MKPLIIIILMLIIVNSCFSEDFEGVIEYKSTFIAKTDLYTLEEMKKDLGEEFKSYTKNGYYLDSTFNVDFMSYQLFRYDENKIYYKNNFEDDTLIYLSTLREEESSLDFKVCKKTDTILNTVCDKLVWIDGKTKKTYFYSSDYSLDPEFYKGYKFLNTYALKKMIKSVYLKMIIENDLLIYEVTAIKITRKKLNDSIFELPRHKVLISN